jgi:hypothetical protein
MLNMTGMAMLTFSHTLSFAFLHSTGTPGIVLVKGDNEDGNKGKYIKGSKGMDYSEQLFLTHSFCPLTGSQHHARRVGLGPWVGSGRVRSGRVGSGWIRLGWVGLGRVGLGWVGSGRVRSGRVGSGRVGSGRVESGRVGSGHQVRSGQVRTSPVGSSGWFVGSGQVIRFGQVELVPVQLGP